MTYMSSAGPAHAAADLPARSAGKGGKIVLVGLSEEIKDTMSLTGFLDFFTTCRHASTPATRRDWRRPEGAATWIA